MLGKCCAITGHRPQKFPWKYDETDSRCVALKAVLADQIIALLPCKEQADKWAASSRDLYYSILDRADSLVYVSRAYHKKCMLERNRFLVDHAAALLAVYNGERRGGTAATLRYAQKMGREIIVINPITRLISRSNSTLALPQF